MDKEISTMRLNRFLLAMASALAVLGLSTTSEMARDRGGRAGEERA
jgi:hypothetical protein